jgi:hypothetical protein
MSDEHHGKNRKTVLEADITSLTRMLSQFIQGSGKEKIANNAR